jgi:hypothetical protein
MAARSRPHAYDAVFRRASERNIFGCRTGRHRTTLAKAGMVEALARGKIACMTISGAGKRTARGQWGKTVLRTE